MRNENLDVFFADFGVEVQWNASKFKGILDMPDELAGDMVLSTEYILTVKTSDVVGLRDGNLLTVDNEDYRVRSCRKLEDGKLTGVMLGKV